MNQVTRNRGPDDEGIYCNDSLSLGHTRLSIIDLSENGHQPMSNENRTIWITFNGEIFNFQSIRSDLIKKGHTFQSNTDSEVIIHAYEEFGSDCVKKFNGMWAFCLYDQNDNTLILGRDQFGIKPLYYYLDDEKIIFSSMISAILCHNIRTSPNDRAIMEYLAHNLEDHSIYTFFTNINKIPQDSLVIYNLTKKTVSTHKWYYPAFRKDITVQSIHDSFFESVRLRTIADVPVGSCLSGGIDSTAIVCALDTFLKKPFDTFSLVAPGFSLDESKFITEVGKHVKVQQYFTQISETAFLNELLDFIRTQEEPVTGLSPYAQYRVMKLAHDHNAKVLLDGQGGDEIFAGYVYYFAYYFYELFAKAKFFTLGKEMFHYWKSFRNMYPFKILAFILLPESCKFLLWKKFVASHWINFDYLKEKCDGCSDPRWNKMTLTQVLFLTCFSTTIPHLLRWEDKNSMRWSIESRPPFLDVNLVEAALAIPSELKIKNGKTKKIFKEAISENLPPTIRNRSDKVGFAVPEDEFFRNENIIKTCKEIIYSESFKNRPYWNWEELEKEYIRHIEGKSNIGDTIWKWINLEIWLQEFFINRQNG